MMRIEIDRAAHHRNAAAPVSRNGEHHADESDRGQIERIQRDHAIGRAPHRVPVARVVVHRYHPLPPVLVGGIGLDGLPRGAHGTRGHIGQRIQSEPSLVVVHERERRPRLRVPRVRGHRPLQPVAQPRVLVAARAGQVVPGAQHEFVWTELVDRPIAQRRRHRADEHAAGARERCDHPRRDFVLQLEDACLAESAVVILGPDLKAGVGLHQLDAEADGRSRSPHGAFDNVSRGVGTGVHAQMLKS